MSDDSRAQQRRRLDTSTPSPPHSSTMICTNKICQLITTILLALYARSLYYDRYKLRSFPFIAKYFFDNPSLHFPSGKGKIAVVTGANSGLGLETTRQMALSGVHVVMACRSLEKGVRLQGEESPKQTTTTQKEIQKKIQKKI